MENATEINFAHNHADFTNFMQIPDGLLHPVCIINGYILPKLISVNCQSKRNYDRENATVAVKLAEEGKRVGERA